MGHYCVLKSVEQCKSYVIYRNREKKHVELRMAGRKCSFLYHYYMDPDFGLMNARIQTWFPFSAQVCLNGREWLARRMDQIGLRYERYDNSFPWIEDFPRAQQEMKELTKLNWTEFLDGIAYRLNPAAGDMFAACPMTYYWSGYQTEWATDLAFGSPRALGAIYPQLTWGAITSFSSPDVLRFLGRGYNNRFSGEIDSNFKDRPEGIRVKHSANGNSVKMYDKGPHVLRIETTINQPRDLKVYRRSENDPTGDKKWLPMRKGVADFYRRSQISQKTNERYLDTLASLDTSTQLQDVFASVCRRIKRKGRTYRPLRLFERHDQTLLKTILRPEFLATGFRNRDLVEALYPGLKDPQAVKRAAARISYRLRLLHAHGLIAKLPRTRRYRITSKGCQISTAAIVSQHVTVQQLTRAAA